MVKAEDNSREKATEGGQDIFLPSAVRLGYRRFTFLDLLGLQRRGQPQATQL